MFKMLGAAVAAVVLSCAGAAQAATVIKSWSGSEYSVITGDVALPGAGTYRVTARSTTPITAWMYGGYDHHWDVFVAPPPKPHSQALYGNNSDWGTSDVGSGYEVIFEFLVPETTRVFSTVGGIWAEIYGVPVGTPVYTETRADNPFMLLGIDAMEPGDPFPYTLTIELLTPVPEPATWALMISGFALVGFALRRRLNVPAEDVDLGMVAARDAA